MPFSIDLMKAALVGGGARPALFEVVLNNPIDSSGDAKLLFTCTSAQLPGSEIGKIPMKYFGREFNMEGTQRFTDWTINVVNDEDFIVRNAMERWVTIMNGNYSNLRAAGRNAPNSCKCDAEVFQYGKTGNIIKKYKACGLFPINISPIDLNWEASDQIEHFSITFAMDYWTTLNSL